MKTKWKSADGTVRLVEELATSHLVNIINFMRTKARRETGDYNIVAGSCDVIAIGIRPEYRDVLREARERGIDLYPHVVAMPTTWIPYNVMAHLTGQTVRVMSSGLAPGWHTAKISNVNYDRTKKQLSLVFDPVTFNEDRMQEKVQNFGRRYGMGGERLREFVSKYGSEIADYKTTFKTSFDETITRSHWDELVKRVQMDRADWEATVRALKTVVDKQDERQIESNKVHDLNIQRITELGKAVAKLHAENEVLKRELDGAMAMLRSILIVKAAPKTKKKVRRGR